MSKRDMLLGLARGDLSALPEGYAPAGFFLHFGPEYHQGPAAVAKHEEFFRFTGMDFVKIQYERRFPAQEIRSPEDWSRIPAQGLDFFEPQLQVARGLVERLKFEALVIMTLYSPFMCAGHPAGRDILTEHMRMDPDAVRPAIEAMTESLLNFVRACAEIGVDGFYHSTQGGESGRFDDPRIFLEYVKPYDLEVMRECERLSAFNILHVCDYLRAHYGGYDDLTRFSDYPGHIVNSSLEIGPQVMSPAEISAAFGRPYMGGLDRLGALADGTVDDASSEARRALQTLPPGSILGADCTVPNDTPWENLRVAIEVAHGGQ